MKTTKDILTRSVKLIPKYMQLEIGRNRMSISFDVIDPLSEFRLGETYINFDPSEKLINQIKGEIDSHIKNQKEK